MCAAHVKSIANEVWENCVALLLLDAVNIKTIDKIFENLCILLLSERYNAEQEVSLIDTFVLFSNFYLTLVFERKAVIFKFFKLPTKWRV